MHRAGLVVVALLVLLVTACSGYQAGYGSTVACYKTICVPYVEGDHDGRLTSELIYEIESSGAIKFCSTGADLVLSVKLLDFREENIGFRYDTNKLGELTDNVIPSETRLTVLAEVTVCERCSDRAVIGPDLLSTSIEYDHDYYTNDGGVNVFSLGQLNDIDLAGQVAYRPLVRALAQRVTDHVINSW